MGERIIRASFKVGDVLTDPTSAKLSDAGGVYGVKRDDTDEVIVADGTDMTRESVGVYSYSFTYVNGVAYTAWVEFVYNGNTYRKEYSFEAVTAPDDTSMMVSFFELRERIGRFAFGERDLSGRDALEIEDIDACIKDALQAVYSAHKWSFLYPVYSITTESGVDVYDLPNGYDSLMGPITYPAGSTDFYPRMKIISESEIRRKKSIDDTAGSPEYAAIVTAEYDPTVGSKRQIRFHPTPDGEYVLSAPMRLRATMIDTDNPYPLGAELLSPVIIEGCLAAAERTFRDAEEVHAAQYARLLEEAIETDKDISSPDYLGRDCQAGDDDIDLWDRAGSSTIMFDGNPL